MAIIVCEICGKQLDDERYSEQFENVAFTTCHDCHMILENMESTDFNKQNEALQHLFGCVNAGTISFRAKPCIYKKLGIKDEQISASKEREKRIKNDEEKKKLSGNGLNIAGFCFLILAIILYIVSVSNDYGVANIQTTVFSAAAFVVANISFVGARIINAVYAASER